MSGGAVYLARRLVGSISSLFVVSVLGFQFMKGLPGTAVDAEASRLRSSGTLQPGVELSLKITEATQDYSTWLGRISVGDFGISLYHAEPVSDLLIRSLPPSLAMGALSFLLTVLLAVPIGFWSSVRDGSRIEMVSSFFLLALYAAPPFCLALVLISLSGRWRVLAALPIQGFTADGFSELSVMGKLLDIGRHLILPTLCLTAGFLVPLVRLIKYELLKVQHCDFIRTARSKGLSEVKILTHHAFPAAGVAVTTSLGQWMAYFLSGTLAVEVIFGINGMGRLGYEAILRRDYPVLLACLLVLATFQILGNLLGDFSASYLNPKLRFGRIF